jgi:diaminohydroxyphosphoribosylaminopyrimidine deaminase / 5-amino-6-(5-phosphoribosylamino)uracil reductase
VSDVDDQSYMRRALELARIAEGSVSPRPPVGALVVDAGETAGEGWDTPSPGPHAEVMALEAAGDRARGSTVYVTLEPCAHTGATPPCAEALIKAGVGRVVTGARDPNPRVDGGGLSRLRAAGIDVEEGVLAEECESLIEPFSKWAATSTPFVTLKLAATLDGKVAAPDGTSQWITGPEARREVHELRRRVDAVLVGSMTVERDDPSLTARTEGVLAQPLRVVVDGSGRTPPRAKVLDPKLAPSLVATREGIPDEVKRAWEQAGAEVAVVDAGEDGVDLSAVLAELGQRGLCHVLCEGGPTIAWGLLAAGLVDRLLIYLAPKVIGGEAPGMFRSGAKTLAEAWGMRIESVVRLGEDIRIEARPEMEALKDSRSEDHGNLGVAGGES